MSKICTCPNLGNGDKIRNTISEAAETLRNTNTFAEVNAGVLKLFAKNMQPVISDRMTIILPDGSELKIKYDNAYQAVCITKTNDYGASEAIYIQLGGGVNQVFIK